MFLKTATIKSTNACCNKISRLKYELETADAVIIGAGARVLGPITLGEGAQVGANAVVVKDVPARATAVGVPATVRADAAHPEEQTDRAIWI